MMTRRVFAGALAGFAAAPTRESYRLKTFTPADLREAALLRDWIAETRPALARPATIARRIPEWLIVARDGGAAPPLHANINSGCGAFDAATARSGGVFELRLYDGVPPDRGLLDAAGIVPLISGERLHLIRFESLRARHRAWTMLAAAPEWQRTASRPRVIGISIYS